MADHTGLQGFEILGKLGEGAFAEVYKVRRKQDGQMYALKKIRLTRIKEKQRENALNQVRILASESSRHIIDYKQAFFDQPSNSLCIVMQLAAKGDLLKLVHSHTHNRTSIPQSLIWQALVHIGQGLRSLHARKILHRDLKCANIFLTGDGVFKLGDLNVSKVLKHDLARTQTGTPYYASPEVWKDRPYGVKSDMWSLGCILYEMAAQKPPFSAGDLQGLYKKIIAGIFPRIPISYSDDLAKVISMLLKQDPQSRPTASQLLSSPMVQSHCHVDHFQQPQELKNELLQTIVMNHRNLKSIHNVLPKSNYDGKGKTKEGKDNDGNGEVHKERKRVQSVAEPIISKLLESVRKNTGENQSSGKRDRVVSSVCPVGENKANILESLEMSRLPKIDTPITKRNIQAMPTPLSKVIQNSSVVADRKASPKQTPSSSRIDILASSQQKRANKQNLMRGGELMLAMKLSGVKQKQQSSSNLGQKVIYPSWWMQ